MRVPLRDIGGVKPFYPNGRGACPLDTYQRPFPSFLIRVHNHHPEQPHGVARWAGSMGAMMTT
jgi:hypothetical protein